MEQPDEKAGIFAELQSHPINYAQATAYCPVLLNRLSNTVTTLVGSTGEITKESSITGHQYP